jgi:acetyl esterase/lipase
LIRCSHYPYRHKYGVAAGTRPSPKGKKELHLIKLVHGLKYYFCYAYSGNIQTMKKILLFLLLPTAITMKAQLITTIPLYNNEVPNSIAGANKEHSTFEGNITRIANVSSPTLTMYKPAHANGRAVIICPGGGYAILAFDHEGTRIATELNKWGVTAFVLKYRLPDDAIMFDKSIGPLQDAQQAIRLVRANAKQWGVYQNKIGIMGFSAGGHLAATAATHFNFKADGANTDTTSLRPDFAILIYAVISFDSTIAHIGSANNLIGANAAAEKKIFFSNEQQVTTNTPPSFLVHAGNDDAVPVANSIRYYEACIKNNVPAEMHLYPKGGHGFSMHNTTTDDKWMERLKSWMNRLQ